MTQHILFGSKRIDFTLRLLQRKSLTIKVHPDGSIEVLAPADADISKIKEKLKIKAPWILKQVEHFNKFKPGTKPRKFVNGETHLYLGRQYRLKIFPGSSNEIKLYRGQLCMYATAVNKEALEKQLNLWYRQKATSVFHAMLMEVLPKFKKNKIEPPVLSVRTMTKRWGSCTPGGKIILNTELIKAPKGSIEYVIVHELCHLVHHNHTKHFFALQDRVLPDWKKWKDKLEYTLA